MTSQKVGRNASSRPLSVPEITRKAEDFDYDPSIPLKYWLRTATLLLKEANIYLTEGRDQHAYLLFFRHANLVLGHLAKHSDAKQGENRQVLERLEKGIPTVLDRLAELKPRVARSYETYQKTQRERENSKSSHQRGPSEQPLTYEEDFSPSRRSSEADSHGSMHTLAPGENKDLAVKLAQEEIKRREWERKSTRQAGISQEEEQERRGAGLWGDWERALTQGDPSEQADLQAQIQRTGTRIVRNTHDGEVQNGRPGIMWRASYAPLQPHNRQVLNYHYPTIPKREDIHTNNGLQPNIFTRPSSEKRDLTVQAPDLPPKKPSSSTNVEMSPPPRPEKTPVAGTDPEQQSGYDPAGDQSQEQIAASQFTFKPSAFLENGDPLRTIFISPHLRHRFLEIASPNTNRNLETCGILCGTLISNALFVSKLIIPEQENTSDTCETVNESALFDYCDAEDLMMLGWIHTHPTQTCFMSSRDLHTHCGYQVMMPESIAIVCAPSKSPSWGIFRLTDPPGMKVIRNCTRPGIFHPHETDNIYTDALKPGHVVDAAGLAFQVVDLRPGNKGSNTK